MGRACQYLWVKDSPEGWGNFTSERVEPPRPLIAADSEQESENHQKDPPLRYP